jgi:predicted anti-sigma-YlaC factor YlaD
MALAAGASACSIKTMAVKTVANTLSDTGDVFSRDNDPELIRDAVPFALKLYESLLESVPDHAPLLVATCSSFTQYANAFVQSEADIVRFDNYDEAKRLNARALALYLRGRDYCMRALDVRSRGIAARLSEDPPAALARATRGDVPLLYWTAASWGLAIALAPDRPELLIDFPVVRALVDRALALDESWNKGALHEMLITIEGVETFGGTRAKAREHFDRAVALQKGLSPGPYVALAMSVSLAAQERAEFERLLNQALEIDPEGDPSNRLATLVTQRRAKALLEHVTSLFAE